MNKTIYVWDLLLRIFHWSLAVAFTVCYATGEEDSALHVYSGYLILALLAFRILWGFIGPAHARFTDFVRSPVAAVQYLKGLIRGGAENYVGHNPAGGWMVIALLVSISLTGVSGLKVYGLEGHGPLAATEMPLPVSTPAVVETVCDEDDEENEKHKYSKGGDEDEEAEEYWEEIHELLANFSVFLVVLHLVGVVASSLRHRQNLIRAMVTGYKQQ